MATRNLNWNQGTTQFDVAVVQGQSAKSYGKNFKPLVSSGQWAISGYRYGSSRCQCCGRPIRHLLFLKNEVYDAILSADPEYAFPEVITIGVVCGPAVFVEAAREFYSDPEAEWKRQHSAWKHWIKYVDLCMQNRGLWESVNQDFRAAVDRFLDNPSPKDVTSAQWWRVRDAKVRVLRTGRDSEKKPRPYPLYCNLRVLVDVAVRCGIVSAGEWEATRGADAATTVVRRVVR